jgi:ATP-dependent exoDNAse (exonuclease V) alpha subunit
MYEQIRKEIASDSFYGNNFANEGQQFVAWYLRRVLLLDIHATRAAITDGQLDKQIDAIVVEDGDDRRVRVIQGKFTKPSSVDAAPVREVLSAWERLRDLPSLQVECSGKLAERLETMRIALEEDYEVQFELLTTGFLARASQDQFRGDPSSRHLYMVDESSLASTRQMQAFMEKIGSQDRVLLIGDTRQHQSVDAGKPFEQMQQAGMQTSQLDQIMRQKDPELLRAVEHLSKNETATGLTLLQQQGRVTEIPDNVQRIEAIAKEYVAKPENTLVVSPDNASRQEINNAIRTELQASGVVSKENHSMNVLTPRSDMTGVDRSWAARYQPDDVLHYTRGSKEHGIERGSYTTVISANHKENQITVQKPDGQHATYDPKRLQGIAAYREISREFAQGDRIQFTANNRELAVSNRDMGTIERIDANQISVKMDGAKERTVTFDVAQMRHFDHGYAVTSHSSQGLTADRVLVNMDTNVPPELINTRFAYVSVSRASETPACGTASPRSANSRRSTSSSWISVSI